METFIDHYESMMRTIRKHSPQADFVFKAAAVADYTFPSCSDQKLKKSDGEMTLSLQRTQDILAWLGKNRREGQILCGFSMETQNLVENSRAKLTKKGVDMICANSLKTPGAGFGVDTNVITLITKEDTVELPLQSKESAANAILDKALSLA